MPKAVALLIVSLALPSLAVGSEPTISSEAAVCFNDSDNDGDYGVWIYEGYSDWRLARDNPKGMLVFGFEPGRSEYSESELEYCFYCVDVREHKMSLCESGTLVVDEIVPLDRIVGRYSFVLQDGTKKTGEFSASYCPITTP